MNHCPKKNVRKSLRYSIIDGSAWSAMAGLTQDYITPFALALRATTAQIGLLSSVPNLVMALSQLKSPGLAEKAGSRKGLILPAVLLHALMWFPILLLPYLFPAQPVWWLIAFQTMGTAAGSLGNPAWGSLMADLVPDRVRGRYFGTRGRINGLVSLVFFLIGGATLSLFTTNILLGFALIFGAAAVFRLVSWYFLWKMYEPAPITGSGRPVYSIWHVLRKAPSSNLGRFTIYISVMNFCVNLSGPFFAVYMLRDLKLDYLTYVIIVSAASLANLLFVTFWGRRADSAGNIRVLRVSSVLVPLIPILWIVSHEVYYLIAIQVLSGFAWAGFNLTSSNFLYDASPPANRTRCIALFNAVNGLAICLGALAGGYLAQYLPPVLGYQLLTLFLLSGALRAIIAATLLHSITEVRHVAQTSTIKLLFGWLSPRNRLPPRFGRKGAANYIRQGEWQHNSIPIGRTALPKESLGDNHGTALARKRIPKVKTVGLVPALDKKDSYRNDDINRD